MALSRQFNRSIRLSVAPPVPFGGGLGPRIEINPTIPSGGDPAGRVPLHVQFLVTKSITPEPQRATITCWGLQKTTRDAIAGATRRVIDWIPGGVSTPLVRVDGRLLPGDPIVVDTSAGMAHVELFAGFDGTSSLLFSGTASRVKNQRANGTDWITTIQVGDGELSLTQGEANKSFEAGATAAAYVEYFASVLGLSVAPTPSAASLSTYVLQGSRVAQGRARKGLSDILDTLQLSWWVEDGVIWILGLGEYVPGPPVVTSPQDLAGIRRLLDSPMRIDDGGVQVRMQLAPEVRPGHRLLIVSSELAGEYRIEHVSHAGDNRSGPFETQAIVRTQNPIGL